MTNAVEAAVTGVAKDGRESGEREAVVAGTPLEPKDMLHLWNAQGRELRSPEDAEHWVAAHLQGAQTAVSDLLAITGERTVQNTLEPYDRAVWHLRMAGSQAHVMFMVHPLAGVRDAVQALSQQVSAASVALSLNQAVYRALEAIDAGAEEAATRFYLERTLLGYRLSGVDRDEATRDRIRALADRMTELSMQFSRTVQDDVRRVEVQDPNDLRGLPEDYLLRHGVREEGVREDGMHKVAPQPGDPVGEQPARKRLVADGPIVITTDPPDMTPVMNYAASASLRRALYLAYNGRGYPENQQVLLDLLQAREEMATLLEFRSWADLATVDQMMGSAANMRKFLGEVEEAALATADREWVELEAFVRDRDPHALPLTLSDARFWEEQFRRARYAFDSQSVRPYFPYEQVEAGVLLTAGKLFGVRFQRVLEAPVWNASVKAFDVLDGRRNGDAGEDGEGAVQDSGEPQAVIGRIYLDMHPREGKSKWFSECSLVGGVSGRQVPEASLVCNFPEPTANDAGLMQYADVVTYFHEFGHLMHEVLGGQQRWAGQCGIATEGDFVVVPSQMLEEFFEDPDLLRTFARHVDTGEPIPYETVARMTKASAHGRALSTMTQVMYATYSMETHDRRAADLDLDTLLRDGYDRFSRYEFVEGNRMYAAFTHLVGYTSNYYTYLYDKVIALEFFRQFAQDEERRPERPGGETGQRYRRTVLEPGGSQPARALVKAFLGREDVSMDALRGWIAQEYAEV